MSEVELRDELRELVGHLVAGGIEGVGDLSTHDGQNSDDHESDQRDQQTILHQCLSFLFHYKTLNHFTSSF